MGGEGRKGAGLRCGLRDQCQTPEGANGEGEKSGAGRSGGGGEEGVTPSTSAAPGFVCERRWRWAWQTSFPGGPAGG